MCGIVHMSFMGSEQWHKGGVGRSFSTAFNSRALDLTFGRPGIKLLDYGFCMAREVGTSYSWNGRCGVTRVAPLQINPGPNRMPAHLSPICS